ncbi:MAG: hypothetical protein WCL71_05935 [Deltaproteobacteria bacterium]
MSATQNTAYHNKLETIDPTDSIVSVIHSINRRGFFIVTVSLAIVSISYAASKKKPQPTGAALEQILQLRGKDIAASRQKGTTEAPNPESTRITTSHDHAAELTVFNLSPEPVKTIVRWFWVGRYEKSKNIFRASEGEKSLELESKKGESILIVEGEVENHITKSKNGSYISGGHIIGWVAFAVNARNEIIASAVSLNNLKEYVANPPPKQRK